MYVMINNWTATLSASLPAAATILPVSAAAATDLGTLLGSNETTLFIRDGVYAEVVRATVSAGNVVIVRAQEGTTARVFASGACARAELSAAGLAELICSSNCGCDPVDLRAGETIEQPHYNAAWNHTWYFTGTNPLTVTVIAKPAWLTVDTSQIGVGLLSVSGTPNVTADGKLSLSVTGCNGSVEIIEETLTICSPTGIA